MELLDPLVKIKISAVFSALTALACIIIYGCGKDKKPIIFLWLWMPAYATMWCIDFATSNIMFYGVSSIIWSTSGTIYFWFYKNRKINIFIAIITSCVALWHIANFLYLYT